MLSVYVDGSGGPNSGFGYYVRETGKSFYEKRRGITNNQAEYLAIIAALEDLAGAEGAPAAGGITIFSDSRNAVCQLNHEFAINSPALRDLARRAWPLIAASGARLAWIPRGENPAGRMLGS